MDLVEEPRRIDAVPVDQPAQGGAVALPVAAAQFVGRGPGDAELTHDETGHAGVDLVEKPRRGVVECVVEVEDPGLDMAEIRVHGAPAGSCRR